MKTIVESTGEIIELDISSPEKMVEAWRTASEYIKAYEKIKDAIKKDAPADFEHDGYKFRISAVQRYNYDKSTLRQVFDEDTLDLFLEPNKPSIDKYIKEHLLELGADSTKLRNSMVAIGRPYSVVKLEKLT
jgi:hypothetical protein